MILLLVQTWSVIWWVEYILGMLQMALGVGLFVYAEVIYVFGMWRAS